MTTIETTPGDAGGAATPDTAMPDVVTPDVVTPEVTTPEVITPDVVTPEVITGAAAAVAATAPMHHEHTGASPATKDGETRLAEIIVETSGECGVV
jgi:hypothetical protein